MLKKKNPRNDRLVTDNMDEVLDRSHFKTAFWHRCNDRSYEIQIKGKLSHNKQ